MQIFLRTPVLEQNSEQEIGQVSQPACPPKPSSLSSVSSEMEFARLKSLTWHRFSADSCLCKDWIMSQCSFLLYILNYLFKSGYLNYFRTPPLPQTVSNQKAVYPNP